MPKAPARSKASITIDVADSTFSEIESFRMGFIEATNPKLFNRMATIATLNAAKTMVKPMQAEAPVRTGRLKGAVKARRAKFNRPAGVVGISAGRSRGDARGAWYRWFITSGTSGMRKTTRDERAASAVSLGLGITRITTAKPVKPITPNPFITRVGGRADVIARAVQAVERTYKHLIADKIFMKSGKLSGSRAKPAQF